MVEVGIWSQSRYMHSWSEIPNTLLFFHTTFSPHCILHGSAQTTDGLWADCAGCSLFVFWPKQPRWTPCCCRWGSEEGGHCYSVADEIKRPPHPPAALPAMLHTLKVIHYCWIAAQCIPLHFVTLPWPILCQKLLALTVLWWIKALLQLWNRAEFLIHVKSAFLFRRNIFNAACNSPSVLFFTSVVTFVKLKEKFKLTSFKSLKETSIICLKEVKIWTSKIQKWKRSISHSYKSRNTWQ